MTDPDRAIWAGMLAYLRKNHAPLCRQWFEELEPLGITGGAMHLRAHSAVHRDYLKRQCAEPFNDAARTASGRLLSVRFLGPEDRAEGLGVLGEPPVNLGEADRANVPTMPSFAMTEPKAVAQAMSASAPAAGESKHLNGAPGLRIVPAASAEAPEIPALNPDYTFEQFVVGPGNRLAHAAAQAAGSNPGRAYNPLFIHGGVGLGKTHLLQAVCLRILEHRPGARIAYLTCEAFITQFMDAVQAGQMVQFRHRFRDVDVLIIDDIQFLTSRERSQEEFFHTFNALYQSQRQIVLSSDAPPEEIPDLEDRLVSRFKWGLVAKIDPPDFETRAAILKNKSRLRGIALPNDVAEFVAHRIDSNIRELEGAITRLQIQSSVEGRPITLELAQSILGMPTRSTGAEVAVQAIIGAVTEFYRIRLVDLQSKRRQRSVALPRQVCMYLIRKLTRHSLEEIGGHFGNRDHTTVMHAIKTIEAKRGEDGEFDLLIRTLEDQLALPASKGPGTIRVVGTLNSAAGGVAMEPR
ncbi:MAG: chromosomal replication initiator protein DnaA [Planctomycetota bacterium]|nr:chromosomal replication initiator protein DnaA [Planctomycetota bacterium]